MNAMQLTVEQVEALEKIVRTVSDGQIGVHDEEFNLIEFVGRLADFYIAAT